MSHRSSFYISLQGRRGGWFSEGETNWSLHNMPLEQCRLWYNYIGNYSHHISRGWTSCKVGLLLQVSQGHINSLRRTKFGEQGWRSGESARLLPMWPGFDSGLVSYVGWLCCWFSSCSEGFSPDSLVFLRPQKPAGTFHSTKYSRNSSWGSKWNRHFPEFHSEIQVYLGLTFGKSE